LRAETLPDPLNPVRITNLEALFRWLR
jgi:hypothetical protein